MKIKITSDSTCDLSKDILEAWDISIIPLSVTLGSDVFRDGEDMAVEDIYRYVDRTGCLPKTSAVNIEDYRQVFRYWTSQGYEVVHFNISADFSSSYRNACLAAEAVGSVRVVDSRNLSTGQGLVVLRAAELAREGRATEDICRICSEMTGRVEASFVIDSLEYLQKGGRCTALAAFGANLLKLKPCIEVIDGKMTPPKKYRGTFEKVIQHYVEDRLSGRDDIDKTRIFITHTRCDEALAAAVRDTINRVCPGFGEIIETTAGSTITSHCGPNTLGVLFVRRDNG